ncbi:glycosyltransferase [Escherichia coli]
MPDDGILAGSCANLTKRKGIDLVIQTLTKEHKIYYIVAGNGIEKHNLINLVKARKLHERVYFIDFLDEPESFMSQLDVFLMPSRSEGFGLTVLESTKLGIPVITSNIPIFMELFDQMCLTFDIKKSIYINRCNNPYAKKSDCIFRKNSMLYFKIGLLLQRWLQNTKTSIIIYLERFYELFRFNVFI